MEGHTACIVGITDIGSGDYVLTIQHDIQQGVLGGTVRELIIYDSDSGSVYGTAWSRKLEEFVIERPGPPP